MQLKQIISMIQSEVRNENSGKFNHYITLASFGRSRASEHNESEGYGTEGRQDDIEKDDRKIL